MVIRMTTGLAVPDWVLEDDLPRRLLVAIQKGGSGKTTLVSALAQALAAKGRRVLVIDADQQGNLTQDDLGVPDEQWDKGKSLAAAFQYGTPLTVIKDVRPNLDLVMGGPAIGMVSTAVAGNPDPPDLAENLRHSLRQLNAENEYDLIIFDSGHGDKVLLIALLEISSDLVIPTKEDAASLRGIAQLAVSMKRAIHRGSRVKLLGVVLFDVDPKATLRHEYVIDQVREILQGTDVEPFQATIRHAAGPSVAQRDHNQTAQELALAATQATGGRLKTLRLGKGKGAHRLSADLAINLANDYQQLTREILQRLSRAASETSGSTK